MTPTISELNRWAAERMEHRRCTAADEADARKLGDYPPHVPLYHKPDNDYMAPEAETDFCADLNAAWALAEKILMPLGHCDLQLTIPGLNGGYRIAIFGLSLANENAPAEALTRAVYAATEGK